MMFLAGGYVVGAMFTFLFVSIFAVLTGRSSELWRPFVYAAFWFILFPFYLAGKLR